MKEQLNDIQRLIKLRGLDAKKIASAIGLGYHLVQKTIKGLRTGENARFLIADHLGLTRAEAFGPDSAEHLQRLIIVEIGKHSETQVDAMKKTWLKTA